jgi:hypothetical protein
MTRRLAGEQERVMHGTPPIITVVKANPGNIRRWNRRGRE